MIINAFQEAIAGAGLLVSGVFISKAVEKPVVWIQNRWLWPSLGRAYAISKTKGYWKQIDQVLRENPTQSLREVLYRTKVSIEGASNFGGKIPDARWEKFVEEKMAQFDFDAHRGL